MMETSIMKELSGKDMTAAACSQSECEECEIQGKLLCVHQPKDLIDFYVLLVDWTLQRTQCNRCYNLSCPINRVPDDVKDSFFRHYPAWGKTKPERT
jgi:hypothetical protein